MKNQENRPGQGRNKQKRYGHTNRTFLLYIDPIITTLDGGGGQGRNKQKRYRQTDTSSYYIYQQQ